MREVLARFAVLRREIAAVDARRELGWTFALAVTALVLGVAWVGSHTPATATSIDLGRRLFHALFGLLHAAALVGSALAAATSLTRERQRFTDEALVLSGVSARKRVVQHFAAAWTVTAALLAGAAPVAAVPFAFGGVDGKVTASALLSLAATTALGAAIGVLLGTRTRSVTAARTLAWGTSIAVGAALWVTLGVWLGKRLCGHFRVGHHGLLWWAEVIHDPRFPAKLRAVLAVGLFVGAAAVARVVLAVARARLEEASADRAFITRVTWALASLAALALMVPVPWLAAGVASRAWAASVVVLVWAALQTVGVFLFVGEDVTPSRRARASHPKRAFEIVRAPFKTGLLRGAFTHVAITVIGALVLARSGYRAADLARQSASIMPVAPVALALTMTAALVLFTLTAAFVRAFAAGARARAVLGVIFALWVVAPSLVGDVLGGTSGPYSFTPRVVALSPAYAVGAVDTLARSSITFVDLRSISLRSMREVAPLTAVVPAEVALGLVLAALTALVLRRRRAP